MTTATTVKTTLIASMFKKEEKFVVLCSPTPQFATFSKSKFYAENGKITYQKARLLAFVVAVAVAVLPMRDSVPLHYSTSTCTTFQTNFVCQIYNYVIYKHRSGQQHERVIIRRIKVARNFKVSLILENSYSYSNHERSLSSSRYNTEQNNFLRQGASQTNLGWTSGPSGPLLCTRNEYTP